MELRSRSLQPHHGLSGLGFVEGPPEWVLRDKVNAGRDDNDPTAWDALPPPSNTNKRAKIPLSDSKYVINVNPYFMRF